MLCNLVNTVTMSKPKSLSDCLYLAGSVIGNVSAYIRIYKRKFIKHSWFIFKVKFIFKKRTLWMRGTDAFHKT